MTEKTSTPEDSIHNLFLVVEALREEGLLPHASYVEDGIWQIERLRAQVEDAIKVIKGVVTSYPVAAGTSKYGYEEEHDGYGSIRECRLFLEKIAALTSTESEVSK